MPQLNPSMTMTTLRPQLKTALMRQLSQSPNQKKNLLQQGFTLVELMIVIVIVGILSAVALPNFLNQTSKAKGTECTSKVGAMMSQVGAEHLTDSTAAAALLASEIATGDANSTLCEFTDAALTAPLYGVNAEGKGDLLGKFAAKACVNGETGKRQVVTGKTLTGLTVSCS